MSLDTLRAYDAQVADGVLTIGIRKEFDFGNLHQDWAHQIIQRFPGPFTSVLIDMTAVGLVSSTFFAGLLQFYFHYSDGKSAIITLIKPDSRVVRNMAIMQMEKFFRISPR